MTFFLQFPATRLKDKQIIHFKSSLMGSFHLAFLGSQHCSLVCSIFLLVNFSFVLEYDMAYRQQSQKSKNGGEVSSISKIKWNILIKGHPAGLLNHLTSTPSFRIVKSFGINSRLFLLLPKYPGALAVSQDINWAWRIQRQKSWSQEDFPSMHGTSDCLPVSELHQWTLLTFSASAVTPINTLAY